MPRSTPWTGITDNKIITHQDIKQAAEDGYFDQLQTITLDLSQCITKNRVIEHFDVDQTNLELRTTNQLVLKVKARRPCNQCVNYNVVIEQSDLDLSDDGKVYVYYYPCGETGGTMSFTSYQYSGTYLSNVCIQNCPSSEHYVQFYYDGGVNYPEPSSRLIILPGQCTPTKRVVISMSGCTSNSGTTNNFTYQITKPGITRLNTVFEMDQSYGNFDFSVSGSTNNTLNEVFVGNYGEKFGEIFSLSGGTNNLTKTIGYYTNTPSKDLDIVVHSTNSTTFQPFNLKFTCGCTSTIDCNSIVPAETETFVKNVELNILDSGVVTYFTNNGQVNVSVNSVGSYTIYECMILESLKNNPVTGTSPQEYTSPLVLSNPSQYTITYTGTTCDAVPTGSVSDDVTIVFLANQGFSATAYWLDCYGIQQSRFMIAGQSFETCGKFGSATGLPVIYGALCSCSSPL